jgi:hypothetical protein
MSDLPVQIAFELRVLQWALAQVISEEDAESLAKIVMRLTDAATGWEDPNLLQGEQLALKALICAEVMRSYRIKAGKTDMPPDDRPDDEPSFGSICATLRTADATLEDEAAWQDFVKYSSAKFKDDVLQGLGTRLSLFDGLGPY